MNPKPLFPVVRLSLAAAGLLLASCLVVQAVPYASQVTKSGNTVSFILNQSAAGITVLRDGGNPVTPAIDASTAGPKSFDMTGYTTYSIIVTGNTAKGWTQFIPDGTDRNFYFPCSVAINKNPASTNFGKVYIANNNNVTPGNTVAGRLTTDGFFVLRADGAAINLLPYTGGLYLTNDAANFSNPYKINLNPDDDCLYYSSYFDDLAFGFNADMSVVTQVISNDNKTVGQYVESVYATGKQSAGNRRIYTVDSHYLDARVGLISYDLGANSTATPTDTGEQVIGPSFYSYYPGDVDRDSSGNWYLTQYRSAAGQAAVVSKFDGSLAWPINTSVWNASSAYTYVRNVGVNEAGGTVAVGRHVGSSGLVYFFDLATGAYKETLDIGNYVRDIAFDLAGNMVSVDNQIEYARFWSPGGYTIATTKSDGTFQLLQSDNVSVTATDSEGSETGPDPAVFTITRSGGPAGDLVVSFTMSGTATSNVDYTIWPQSPFTFQAGDTSTNITITPIDDGQRETTEAAVLTISPGGINYYAVNPTTATVTLADNDGAVRYWDTNDVAAGAGGPAPAGTWGTDNYWSPSVDGTDSTVAWGDWQAAVFSAGTDATDPFTVTLSSPQKVDYVSFEEGSVTLEGANLTLTNWDSMKIAAGLTATINSVLDGTGLTLDAIDGTSKLVLGGANTYSGATTINTGILQLAASDRIPDGSAVSVGVVGAFDLSTFSEKIGSLAGAAGAIITVASDQTLTFGGDNLNKTWSGTAGDGSGGLLAKVGTGIFTIAGDILNPLAISNGVVSINSAARLGAVNAVTIDNSATLQSTSAGVGSDFISPFKTITIGAGGGTLKVTDSSAILMVRSDSPISGPGILTKDGPGELRTYSVEHSFSKLIVKDGLYTAGHSTLLGYSTSFGAIPGVLTPDAITLTNGAQIRKAGGQNVILDPYQGITLQTGGGIIRAYSGSLPQDTGAFVIPGPISGVGRLTLNSTADAAYAPIIVLAGNNTYSGGTALRAGSLFVTNATGSATGSGGVNVTNATLGGDGTISGPVFMSGGNLSPGYSFNTGEQPTTPVTKLVAKLTLTNGLSMNLGATNVWHLGEFSTNNPGTDFDQVELTGGNLTLGGSSVLSINFANNAAAPDVTNSLWLLNREWKIVKISGTAANPGGTKYTTVVNGSYPGVGSFTNYADAGGNIILKFLSAVTNVPPVIESAITGAGFGSSVVGWSSYPGVNYNVEYASNLTVPVYWHFLTNIVGTAGSTTTILDDSSGYQIQRYYRVIIP